MTDLASYLTESKFDIDYNVVISELTSCKSVRLPKDKEGTKILSKKYLGIDFKLDDDNTKWSILGIKNPFTGAVSYVICNSLGKGDIISDEEVRKGNLIKTINKIR